jgi:APA family basic amino acid/polyamine antiporter
VLGTPALFATAYGNVGSSIYYALGVTAAISLGLTPLVFIVSGLIFGCTAASYAEGTVNYPEAGGSSSFARHAFNELVSFGAAWAQMLNYIITVAISAFFVPHYLSIFWAPLKTNPWDIIGGIIVVVVLVSINIIGIKEAATLNVGLAVVDFATQLGLVVLGFILVFDPHVLRANVHWGVAPTWSEFALAIPVAMIAYTGIETVSNLAEEARDPRRTIPGAIRLVAVAVFAIYFTLPWIAMSALPVYQDSSGNYVTKLGLPPEQGGYENDPVLGIVKNLGLHGWVLSAAEIYVGVLAATILFIATNAGVIGASRITYSMSTHRQLPERFRRLHPKYKTPWLSLLVFAGGCSILFMLPGNVDFIGRMYAFGAMLSFTIAHAAVIQMRRKPPALESLYRVRGNVKIGRVTWPIFAVVGGIGTGLAWLVVIQQDPATRYAGLGWLAGGFVFYYFYRRRLGIPMKQTALAPIHLGPAVALEYRSILVPIVSGPEAHEAIDLAARLAAERGSTIVALRVIVLPLDLPLDTEMPEEEALADRLLDDADVAASAYGVRVIDRVVKSRNAGRAIVEEAQRRQSEIVVLGAPRLRHRAIFGKTVDFVLKNAPCRVMVAAGKRAA